MKIAATIARILLGLIFCAAGGFGFYFLLTAPPPAPPGLAGQFQNVLFGSGYAWFTDGVQFVSGLMLLSGLYVPFALILSAAVISNILAFHITMMPSGLPPALVVTALWFIVAWPLRSHFAPLFVRKLR